MSRFTKVSWDELFRHEITYNLEGQKGASTIERCRIEVKYNSSTPPAFSIFVQMIDEKGEQIGTGIHLRFGDLTDMVSKLSEIPSLKNPETVNNVGTEGEKPERRFNYHVYSLIHKNNVKVVLITLLSIGKKAESLAIPFNLCELFADNLQMIRQIIEIRQVANDDATISDALKYLAKRYRGKYGDDVNQFVSKFQKTFEKILKLLGVKNVSNAKSYLESVPFKAGMIENSISLNCIYAPVFDWILTNIYTTELEG